MYSWGSFYMLRQLETGSKELLTTDVISIHDLST